MFLTGLARRPAGTICLSLGRRVATGTTRKPATWLLNWRAIKPVARFPLALDIPSRARLLGNGTEVDRTFAVGPGWGNSHAASCGS